MRQYIACIKGIGEGCDYTIGCNMKYELYEVEGTFEEAIKSITEKIVKEYGCDAMDESAIEEILIVPADYMIQVDINSLREQYLTEMELERQRKQDSYDDEIYLRLKERFKEEQLFPG